MARSKPSPLAPAHLLCVDPRRIDTLIAFHRSQFGDATMTQPTPPGTGIAVGTGAVSTPPVPAPPAAARPAPTAHEGYDFPDETRTADMTPEQRAEYWRFHSQKHEKAWRGLVGDADPDEVRRALGGQLSPQALKDLRDRASKHDALERELMSDKDKAVAEAAENAKRDALASTAPKLVRAEFKAALTGRVPADELDTRLSTLVDTLDLSKFVDSSGDVDTAKVTALVETIAPATGTGTGTGRRGPTATGHGSGSGSGSGTTALTGRELFEQRHKKTTTSA